MEKEKKQHTPKKRILLKIFAVILCLWVLVVGFDFARFIMSDTAVSPVIAIESGGCHCCEERWEDGLGYTMHYSYNSFEDLSDSNPCRSEFSLFGFTIYSKNV